MSNEELTDKACASCGSQPEGGGTISGNCGSDTHSDGGQETSLERARELEGETSSTGPAQPDENGLTIDEACKVIHCTREWLRRKIHSGEIATYRVGGRLRVTQAAISHIPPEQSPGDPT
jgi:excisionase family DNA binding protein